MSDVIDLEELKRVKEIRRKYEKQRQEIEIEIQKLQGQLEILDHYLGDNLDSEWHRKPPLSNDKITNIYKDFMDNKYHNITYTKETNNEDLSDD